MPKIKHTKRFLNGGVPYRYICRDHTKTGAEAFLRGMATFVWVTFSCDEEMGEETLKQFVQNQTQWVDQYLNELLNDTVLVSTKDPLANLTIILEQENMVDVRLAEDVTLGGLKKMMIEDFSLTLKEQTNGKIKLGAVDIFEAVAFE